MQILKLYEMNVDIPRTKLLAARRLDRAVAQLQPLTGTKAAITTAIAAPDRSPYSTRVHTQGAGEKWEVEVGVEGVVAGAPAQAAERTGTIALRGENFGGASSSTDIEDAPPLDAKLMGIGALPFVWYEGCVQDLELLGNAALDTDEVASSPDVSDRADAASVIV